MLPGVHHLALYQGDHWEQLFTLAEDYGTAETPDVRPVDLTGCTVAAQIRTNVRSQTPLAVFTATITDPAAGAVRLVLPSAEATKLTRNGVWDLQITDTGGRITTWLAGAVEVTREVTR